MCIFCYHRHSVKLFALLELPESVCLIPYLIRFLLFVLSTILF
jgi:hypothetical protein